MLGPVHTVHNFILFYIFKSYQQEATSHVNDFFHLVPKFFVRQQNPCSLTAILHSSEHLILQMSFVIQKIFCVSDANKVAKTNKMVVTKFSNLL